MPVSKFVKNIALVGATSNLGSLILKSLLEANRFNITVIRRETSSSKIPDHPSITLRQGGYDSLEFLESSFTSVEAAVLALYYSAIPKTEIKLVEAAAAAGVSWILPTEFNSDHGNEVLAKTVPTSAAKEATRTRIVELARTYPGLKWIGVSLVGAMFLIDVKTKTATLINGGTAKFNTTTKGTVADAVAQLLSLPIVLKSGPSLEKFGNRLATSAPS